MQKSDFLSFLQSLPGKQAHVLSGQHLPEWEDANAAYQQLVQPLPERPAMLGYCIFTGQNDTYYYWPSAVSVLTSHANAGGIIFVDIHPADPWSSVQNITSAWVSNQQAPKHDLLTLISQPTSTAGQRWARVKAKTDEFLSKLPSSALVIFRPLHEAVGLHFWWGMDATNKSRSEAGVKALYKDIHDFIAPRHPNVVWAFAAGMSWYGPLTYGYPGSYVDIAGASLYSDSLVFPSKFGDDYSALQSLGKPLFFTEVGPSDQNSAWDARTILSALRNYPKIVGFQSWQDDFALANVQNGAAVINDSSVLNASDLGQVVVTPPPPVNNVWVAVDALGKPVGVASSLDKARAVFSSASSFVGFVEQV